MFNFLKKRYNPADDHLLILIHFPAGDQPALNRGASIAHDASTSGPLSFLNRITPCHLVSNSERRPSPPAFRSAGLLPWISPHCALLVPRSPVEHRLQAVQGT